MTPLQQLQKMLDGRKYLSETTKEIEKFAKDNNLVIVFGYSDDLIEFRGAINDEAGAMDEDYIYFDTNGLFINDCDRGDYCPHFEQLVDLRLNKIKDLYKITVNNPHNNCWSYSTSIVHLKFKIFEDDNLYCEGIVFDLDN